MASLLLPYCCFKVVADGSDDEYGRASNRNSTVRLIRDKLFDPEVTLVESLY